MENILLWFKLVFKKLVKTSDHKVLSDTMKSSAVSEKTIDLFHSYLSRGAFTASLGNYFLNVGIINSSITKKSISGSS